MAKPNNPLGAVFPNFSSMIRVEISTYQNTGTSDFQIYLKHRLTSEIIIIQPWRSSTGGVYNTIDTWSWTMALNFTQDYIMYATFKTAGQAVGTGLWLDTPLVNYDVGPYFPELLANVISTYVRGNTINYVCESTQALRKTGTPLTTELNIGVQLCLVTTQSYFDTYFTTLLLKNNTQSTPQVFPNGNPHITYAHADTTLIGDSVPITNGNAVIIQASRDISSVRSQSYSIRSYGSTLLYITTPASDSFRTAAMMSAMTGTTAMGIISQSTNNFGTYIGQLGVYSNQTFPIPTIRATQRPYYAVKALLIGQSNLSMTVWNSTSGYLLVKAQPSNTETYYMNDGNGNGTNKFTTLQGTIDIVVYIRNEQNQAQNAFCVPAANISYQSDLNYVSTRPDQFYEVTQILRTRANYPGTVTLKLYYYYAVNSDPPVPGPPIPPPDPPAPVPPAPVEDDDDADEIIREQRAIERARDVVNEVVNPIKGRELYIPEHMIWYTNDVMDKLKDLPIDTPEQMELKARIQADVVDIIRSHNLGNPDSIGATQGAAQLKVQSLINKYPVLRDALSNESREAIQEQLRLVIKPGHQTRTQLAQYLTQYDPNYTAWSDKRTPIYEMYVKRVANKFFNADVEQYTKVKPSTLDIMHTFNSIEKDYLTSLQETIAEDFGERNKFRNEQRKRGASGPALAIGGPNIMTGLEVFPEEERKGWGDTGRDIVRNLVIFGLTSRDARRVFANMVNGNHAEAIRLLKKIGKGVALSYVTGQLGYESTPEMALGVITGAHDKGVAGLKDFIAQKIDDAQETVAGLFKDVGVYVLDDKNIAQSSFLKAKKYILDAIEHNGRISRKALLKRARRMMMEDALSEEDEDEEMLEDTAIITDEQGTPGFRFAQFQTSATRQALSIKYGSEEDVARLENQMLSSGIVTQASQSLEPFGQEVLAISDGYAQREEAMHVRMEQMSDIDKGKIYANSVGIIGRKHLTDDQIALLTNPILSGRTVDNRYETTMALQHFVQRALYAVRYEPIQIEQMRHVFSAYFKSAMQICWQEAMWHGFMQFKVFKSMIQPTDHQEREIYAQLATFVQHKPIYDARNAIDHTFKLKVVEMEDILKQPEKVQNFIERITDHLPDARQTAFNGSSYIKTRTRRVYDLPSRPQEERPQIEYKRDRVKAKIKEPAGIPERLGYIQKRDDSVENQFYEAQRRRLR